MSFLLRCPHCGDRSVYEFRFGGEVNERPSPDAPEGTWLDYTYNRVNAAGVQTEWWYHRSGCKQWIKAVRNTVTNEVLQTFYPEDKPA